MIDLETHENEKSIAWSDGYHCGVESRPFFVQGPVVMICVAVAFAIGFTVGFMVAP